MTTLPQHQNKFLYGLGILCVIAIAAYFISARYAAKQELYAALIEMRDATRLGQVAQNIYVDDMRWMGKDSGAKPYAGLFTEKDAEISGVFVVEGNSFNRTATPHLDRDVMQRMAKAFERNVLRGLVVDTRKKSGYFFLMPTSIDDPLLITFTDRKGNAQKLRGSYKDVVPLRKELDARWYLLMTPPSLPVDFSDLAKEPNVALHYAHGGKGMISVALIEVQKDATLTKADPKVIMVPLMAGWPE